VCLGSFFKVGHTGWIGQDRVITCNYSTAMYRELTQKFDVTCGSRTVAALARDEKTVRSQNVKDDQDITMQLRFSSPDEACD